MSQPFPDTPLYPQLLELIRLNCGLTFGDDRRETVCRAVQERMTQRGIPAPESYYALLRREGEELQALVELLTVNETYFFREPDHLNLLVDTLLPELLNTHDPSQPLSLLSAGCSTGEEAYTLAMLLAERQGVPRPFPFTITGIDIDSHAVAAARNGVYGKPSFRAMDPRMKERWFETAGHGAFRVRDSLRQQVRFEVANLLTAPNTELLPPPAIILYRNVSIYFPQEVQLRIFRQLADLLQEGGVLLVGASETLAHDVGILPLLERQGLFYFAKRPAVGIGDRRSTKRILSPPPPNVTSPPTAVPPTERRQPAPASRHPRMAVPVDTDPRRTFDNALVLARTQRDDEALALLGDLIERNGTFLKAHGLKACLLLNNSRYDEARTAAEAMLELDPLCREACLLLGIIARHRGDNDEGFRRFREALYIDPDCWLAHFYTAEILFNRQERKRALGSYEAALRLLHNDTLQDPGQAFFPLAFNVPQFISICRHKLSLLQENG